MQKLENLGIIGLLRHNVGNPRCGIDLRQGVGYPRCGEAEVPKGTPRVCHDEAFLCRGVVTVHNEQFFFGFLFPNISYSYINSLGTLIKV